MNNVGQKKIPIIKNDILGDTDICDNNSSDFHERESDTIRKAHYEQINNNTNQNSNIFNSNGLNDSLEGNCSKKNKNKSINITRNISLQSQKFSTHNYPHLFNQIILNNLQHKKMDSINLDNGENIKVSNDDMFKKLITKKRELIKYKKCNSFFIPKKIKYEEYISNNKFMKEMYSKKIINNESNTKQTDILWQNNTGFMSNNTTASQTKNMKKDKIIVINNKDVVEFKYADSFTEDNNNSINNNSNMNLISNNTSINIMNKDTIAINEKKTIYNTNNNSNNNTINDAKLMKLCVELKNWLENVDLSIYYGNFIENNIYDINYLINQMKIQNSKLGYDEIELIFKIHKPGHIYRLFCQLEADAKLVNEEMVNFLVPKNKNKITNKTKKNNHNLNLSISNQINSNCINCSRINFLSNNQKNDLKCFLERYNLMSYYQHFFHNGFDHINFVMLQMFTSEPIDELILENCFHIYEHEQREVVLKCLIEEKNKIKNFLESNEYLTYKIIDNVYYEDIIFERNDKTNKEKIQISKTKSCNECIIF